MTVPAPPPCCPEDVNQDGVINIDDLFLVITAWGNCPQEIICTADVNFDITVDIDDLTAVNLLFGNYCSGCSGAVRPAAANR